MNKKGYTFIEIIISLLIFSLIIGLISYAVSQGLNQYRDVIRKTANFWEKTKIIWLQKSFASTIDYYVKDEDWFPFFEGNSEYIVYITESPLANNQPVIACLINKREENGKRKLVYYEIPVYTKGYKEITEFIKEDEKYKKEKEIVLFNNIELINFEFYGADLLKPKPDWYSTFSGKQKKVLPQFIKISFKTESGERVENIFSIRNNSNLKQSYNEIYQ